MLSLDAQLLHAVLEAVRVDARFPRAMRLDAAGSTR